MPGAAKSPCQLISASELSLRHRIMSNAYRQQLGVLIISRNTRDIASPRSSYTLSRVSSIKETLDMAPSGKCTGWFCCRCKAVNSESLALRACPMCSHVRCSDCTVPPAKCLDERLPLSKHPRLGKEKSTRSSMVVASDNASTDPR